MALLGRDPTRHQLYQFYCASVPSLTNKAKQQFLTLTFKQNPAAVWADGTRIPQQRQAFFVGRNAATHLTNLQVTDKIRKFAS